MSTKKEKTQINQDEKTKLFIEQAKTLIAEGRVKNYSEIARDIKWPIQAISDTTKGRKNIPFDVHKRFTDFYGLGVKDWRDEKIALLEEMNKFLKDRVAKQDEANQALEGELGELKKNQDDLKKIQDLLIANQSSMIKELNVLKHEQLVAAAIQLSYQEHWLDYFYKDTDKIPALKKSIGQKAKASLTKMKKQGIESGSDILGSLT